MPDELISELVLRSWLFEKDRVGLQVEYSIVMLAYKLGVYQATFSKVFVDHVLFGHVEMEIFGATVFHGENSAVDLVFEFGSIGFALLFLVER